MPVRVTAIAVFAVSLSSPAIAQVFEISPDGIVSVRDGGGASDWQVANPPAEEVAREVAIALTVPATTTGRAKHVPAQFAQALELAASSADISPTLLSALVWQESRWNPQAVSPKGAVGLTQLMPGTARELGVDSRNPTANLMGGARYLRKLLDSFDGDLIKSLAAYNAGPGRVRRANGVPAIRETRDYVRAIVNRISIISSGANL